MRTPPPARRAAARGVPASLLSLHLAATLALSTIASLAPVHASPLDEPHTGGVGFSGPTTGDLAAVYWNPAAIALIQGHQLVLGMHLARGEMTVRRTAIDPATGLPQAGGVDAGPRVLGESSTQPLRWPPGPGYFAGLAVDLAGRFNLAVALHNPFQQRVRFPTSGAGPDARFHARFIEHQHVALTPVLAVRLGRHLRVGVTPGFLFSNGRYDFDHDTALARGSGGLSSDCGGAPCGAENPAAAARYELRGAGILADPPALTLGGGVHYQGEGFAVGASYSSRPIGNPGGGVVVDLQGSLVSRAASDPRSEPVCATGSARPCVAGRLHYHLPDTYILGASWDARPQTTLLLTARLQRFSAHQGLRVRLVGPVLREGPEAGRPALGRDGLDERFTIYRGWRDELDLRALLAHQLPRGYRLGGGVRVTTGAVPRAALNPAAIDGPAVEPQLGASARWGSFGLALGYALTFMPARTVSASAFDPAAAVACVDAGRDLSLPACEALLAGAARPSAAGRYGHVRHVLTAFATLHF